VPLYIEEVVAKLREQPVDAAESTRVPDTLYEALFARLRSSESALRVVVAAATIGGQFDRGLLASVVTMSDDEVDRVLADLRNARVLEPVGDHGLRFRHELLREVAAELPPPSLRRRLHSRVADALKSEAAVNQPDWPLIALHFELADRFGEAVSAHQKASTAARHRGALGEARSYLSRALAQLAKMPSGTERDQREVKLRLRHGFLASAAEGAGSEDTAEDFERCLQLGRTDPHADEFFATLMALFTYYVGRADLRRADQVLQSLRVGVDVGREWWRSENIGGYGTLCWLRGEFQSARRSLEEAAALQASRGQRDLESEWFMPFDPVVLSLACLAHARWVLGDLAGAHDALASITRRVGELGFPQGPFSQCYADYVDFDMCLETGHVGRAAELATDMADRAERHGFEQWVALGAVMKNVAAAAAALATGHLGTGELSAGILTLTAWVDACRFLEANGYLTAIYGRVARLLMAAGDHVEARNRANEGLQLAEDTGMHYYDAELLRLRAATHTEAAARNADLHAAMQLALKQGATVFGLRAAMDDFESRGEPARASVVAAVNRFPADSTWPDLARARALLA
jgi:tetratricopeptide (TPR) repeat protein